MDEKATNIEKQILDFVGRTKMVGANQNQKEFLFPFWFSPHPHPIHLSTFL
jgi:hypothetical protein